MYLRSNGQSSRMWCPTPKPKVVPRPKPIFTHEYVRRRKTNSKRGGDDDEQEEKEKQVTQQYDPHRHKRHFGVRHTDVTRIFLVDYHKCPSHVQSDRPHGLKKTDITCYLEKVVPSHAVPQPNTNNNVQQVQPTPRINSSNNVPPHQQKKDSTCDARRVHHAHTPSRERRIKHQSSTENPRPETAPTGEMKRLSVTSAGTGNFPQKPSPVNRMSRTSSPLKPLGNTKHGPKDQTTTSSVDTGLKDSTHGFGAGSRSMTAATHLPAGRLQPVPE